MKVIGKIADRILSTVVPEITAGAAACFCQPGEFAGYRSCGCSGNINRARPCSYNCACAITCGACQNIGPCPV